MSTQFRASVRIAVIAGVVTLGGARAWAQGPTINSPSLGGAPGSGGSLLGNAPGSGGAGPGGPTPSILGGRPGASTAKGISTAISSSSRSVTLGLFSQQGVAPTPNNPSAVIPASGPLALPPTEEDPGPEYGLTLDQAIERLIQENLDLKSKFYEIPQAKADLLTASLRANPVFYADSQLVPYGQYTREKPGGQTQYDVNISYPLDISRKRQARTASAVRAAKTIEAQYQDAVRQTIDNLYSAYVDVLQARRTIAFSQASLTGLKGALEATIDLFNRGQKTEGDVRKLRIQVNQAETQLRDGKAAYSKAKQALATQINVPPDLADRIELRGTLKHKDVTLPPIEELKQIALANRPDVVSFRLGLERAKSDVKLQYANRFQDVYVLAQPYTLQDNTPFGLKSPTSWALGVTIPLPLYDRNQGNIQRAKMNVTQTEVELSSTERGALQDVLQAELEFAAAKASVERIETLILPDASKNLEDAKKLFPSEISIVEYLAALQDYNSSARDFLDAQVRFRRAMLDINTAVGQRILP
jgi:cobalt-zinc-cadmium efflux system outer membrane protein